MPVYRFNFITDDAIRYCFHFVNCKASILVAGKFKRSFRIFKCEAFITTTVSRFQRLIIVISN